MATAARVEHVLDPRTAALADVYAEALMDALEASADPEAIADELDSVVALLDGVDGAENLLTASLLSRTERTQLVRRVFDGRTSEPVAALLGVMARHDRLGQLRATAQRFRHLLNVRQGREEVTVITAVELDEDARREVADTLRETLARPCVLTWRTNSDLIGGLVFRIGERVYDGSVAGQLDRVRRRLARGIDRKAPKDTA